MDLESSVSTFIDGIYFLRYGLLAVSNLSNVGSMEVLKFLKDGLWLHEN